MVLGCGHISVRKSWEREYALESRSHVAAVHRELVKSTLKTIIEHHLSPVPQIFETSQARSEHGLHFLSIITSHREVKLEIVLDLLQDH